ncbi:translation initiation factor [Perkinsus sp. BL_2016]|nr:translation initiation factor [Perkinsus sp. BL_2016]
MQHFREHERPDFSPEKAERKSLVGMTEPSYASVIEAIHSFPKEVWLIYTVKFLESYSFFILAYSLVLYLSQEFGFGDEQAAWAYGIYGTLVSVYGLGIGVIIDGLGVRRTLPVGAALTLPVLQIAVKRYTTEKNRSVAFTGFYIVMNIAAMTAAPCIDAVHRFLHGDPATHPFTPYRLLIAAGALLSCISLYVTIRHIKDEDEDEIINRTLPQESPQQAVRHVLRSPVPESVLRSTGVSPKRELVFKEEMQEYAQVTKMLGNARVEAFCFDGVSRLCQIRGQMRKRVWINVGDIVLVSLREFQDNKADIIWKYTPDEARSLKAYGELPANVRPNEAEGFGGDESESDGIEFADFDDDDVVVSRPSAKASAAPAAAAPKVPVTATGEIDLDAI